MKPGKTPFAIAVLLLLAPTASHAVITFTQLSTDTFVVSHRIKVIGSRAKAMKLVHTKAASLCVAAGYSHMEVIDTESQASNSFEDANASVTVRLHNEGGQDRLDCESNADPEYVQQASEKLAKRGYEQPETVEQPASAEPEVEEVAAAPASKTGEGECSIEQIVKMVEAGLSVDQIKAACPGEPCGG